MSEKNNLSETGIEDFDFKDPITIHKVREYYYNVFSLYGHRRSYNKGSIVFQINDTSDEAYIVEKGRVRTYNLTPDGKEVTFEIVNPGECVGLVEVFVNSPRTRNAETISNKNTLLVMKKDQLFNLIFSSQKLGYVFSWTMSHYLMRYQNLVEEFAILPIQGRITQLLYRMAKERGTQVGNCTIIDLPITHDEIAKLVGCSRPTVTIILNELRDQGILSWEQRKIKILRFNDYEAHSVSNH